MKKEKIGIIGGGNMGEALIKGLHKSHTLFVYEINPERVKYLNKKYKVNAVDIPGVMANAEVVILAVKPQDMHAALSLVRSNYSKNDKLFISIAAGLTTKFFVDNLKNALNPKPRIVRAMPNMPALISRGMTAICGGRYATGSDLILAKSILGTIGETISVDESMIDTVTAVSGSGPAYVFLFVEQWINAAMKLGFNEFQAKQLVYKTLLGSAHLLEQSPFDAAELRAKVTSKGGTTQAAMDVFSKGKFDQLIYKALSAAKKRSGELAK
jgi:pyrroline-5-carboxylate reductase